MSEWIAVVDRLPIDDQCVIASGHNYDDKEKGRWVEPSVFSDGEFHGCTSDDSGDMAADFDSTMLATHWQPLPAPPTE